MFMGSHKWYSAQLDATIHTSHVSTDILPAVIRRFVSLGFLSTPTDF